MHRKQRKIERQIGFEEYKPQEAAVADRIALVQSWLDRLMHFGEWFIVRMTLLVLVLIGACTVLAPHIKEFVHFIMQVIRP